MPCIFCRSEENLTDEHLFPAFCGGVLVVPDAACVACNRDVCSKFENVIAESTRTLRNILEITDRYGQVPTSKVVFELDNLKIPARRTSDGEITFQDFVGEIPLPDGKKQRRGFFANPEPAQKFFNKAKQRGEKVNDRPVPRDLVITPVSQQTIQFAFTQEALLLASKIALVAMAYKYGIAYALESHFDKLREGILQAKAPASIFANEYFAANHLRTPQQHSVVTYLSAGMHLGWSIVTLFGGLSYLVQITDEFNERQSRAFSIHYDAKSMQEYSPVVLMDEYNLLGRVHSNFTKINSIPAVDAQWYRIVETYCKANDMDIYRTEPNLPAEISKSSS
jgi:hypothetical protein